MKFYICGKLLYSTPRTSNLSREKSKRRKQTFNWFFITYVCMAAWHAGAQRIYKLLCVYGCERFIWFRFPRLAVLCAQRNNKIAFNVFIFMLITIQPVDIRDKSSNGVLMNNHAGSKKTRNRQANTRSGRAECGMLCLCNPSLSISLCVKSIGPLGRHYADVSIKHFHRSTRPPPRRTTETPQAFKQKNTKNDDNGSHMLLASHRTSL